MKVMVVDDDDRERIVLRYMLEQNPNVVIVGEAKNGTDALILAREKSPELIFLDILMPGMSGLDVAQQLKTWPSPPLFAFVTGQRDYAVEAFELGALDYIKKPLTPGRVEETLHRAQYWLEQERLIDELTEVKIKERIERFLKRLRQDDVYFDRLPVRDRNRVILLDQDDIICVASDKKKVAIVTTSGQYQAGYTLSELENRLDKGRFLRVHQAYIVNLNYIKHIETRGDGSYIIRLNCSDREIVLSRSRVRLLRKRLGI
ncbi:MAG: LytR/AlgR family response regulator transcription factor [Methylocystaceae bacterium]